MIPRQFGKEPFKKCHELHEPALLLIAGDAVFGVPHHKSRNAEDGFPKLFSLKCRRPINISGKAGVFRMRAEPYVTGIASRVL